MEVSAGHAVRLVPEQAGDCRLFIASEAEAQHMRRDVARQIAFLGDPQPHLPIGDDRSGGQLHLGRDQPDRADQPDGMVVVTEMGLGSGV